MIAWIAIVCIAIAVVVAGVQSAKIRQGWIPPRFAGRAGEFLLRKRREYSMLAWLGAVAGPIWLVLAALDWGKPASLERLGLGVVFIICGAIMFALRAQLPVQPVDNRP